MMALPKAISQGSNGAGGGALTAFTAISAAIAELEIIASAVANKANFFMTVPIYFSRQLSSGGPQGKQELTATQSRPSNLERMHEAVKPKRHACADFLGVLAVLPHVGWRVLHLDNNFLSPAPVERRD